MRFHLLYPMDSDQPPRRRAIPLHLTVTNAGVLEAQAYILPVTVIASSPKWVWNEVHPYPFSLSVYVTSHAPSTAQWWHVWHNSGVQWAHRYYSYGADDDVTSISSSITSTNKHHMEYEQTLLLNFILMQSQYWTNAKISTRCRDVLKVSSIQLKVKFIRNIPHSTCTPRIHLRDKPVQWEVPGITCREQIMDMKMSGHKEVTGNILFASFLHRKYIPMMSQMYRQGKRPFQTYRLQRIHFLSCRTTF